MFWRKKAIENQGAMMHVFLVRRMNMRKRFIVLTSFIALVLGVAGEQAWGQRRIAYYDERYPTNWAMGGVSEFVRDALADVGYEIMDADQLKTFMDARIADGASSVVVLCRDIAPDTVVESNSPDCTLRQYLDAGGKVVLYADVPLWNIGHSNGTRTTYKEAGAANILGISGTTYAGDWSSGNHGTVTITAEGAEWGLTETWRSTRWVLADQVDIVLAEDNAGYAAAWIKHFGFGDTTGTFVRIWDVGINTNTIPNVEDLIRVAEYSLWDNSYNVDFNDDYKVDIEDLLILIECWGTDNSLCDIAPTVRGDGVVDRADLEVLMSYYGQELYDPHLLAHWRLDETEGDIAYDSKAENDAVLIGDATWQPEGGQVGGALQFDGVDDYLSAPFILDPVKQSFSVFAWIKGGQPGQAVISQQGAFGDWLSVDSAGALSTGLTFPMPPVTSNTFVADDQWHCVGLVSDGSGMSLYVNDIEVARTDTSPILPATGGLQIGVGKNLEPGSFWSGMIDDVRVYDRVVVP